MSQSIEVKSTDVDFTFADLSLIDSIQQDIANAGFVRPTPIQAACIPAVLEGKDVIGLAQTGTGKTAAFALPMIQRLYGRVELTGLVLAPTRELAAQISTMFNQLGAASGVRVATIVGGVPMDHDQLALRSWPNVLVATPGRLIDHIENGKLSLAEIEMLCVDEADRMHDMGFIPQIRRILAELPENRQTLMFTATMPKDVEHIARRSMRDPVRIQVGVTAPAHRARQELFHLAEDTKGRLLLKLLKASTGRVLVFARTKRGVDRLARTISAGRQRVVRIHGDLEQHQRDRALDDFRQGHCRVLVATDIAARGLDISDIEHVINYDFPHHAEDYVHRIGRTARVDASGLATSFVTRSDRRFVNNVRRLIGDKLPQPVHLDDNGQVTAAPASEKAGRASGDGSPGGNGSGGGNGSAGGRALRGGRRRARGGRNRRRNTAKAS